MTDQTSEPFGEDDDLEVVQELRDDGNGVSMFDILDFQERTKDLSLEEIGAYMHLRGLIETGRGLPDEAGIIKELRLTRKRWEKIGPRVLPLLPKTGDQS